MSASQVLTNENMISYPRTRRILPWGSDSLAVFLVQKERPSHVVHEYGVSELRLFEGDLNIYVRETESNFRAFAGGMNSLKLVPPSSSALVPLGMNREVECLAKRWVIFAHPTSISFSHCLAELDPFWIVGRFAQRARRSRRL